MDSRPVLAVWLILGIAAGPESQTCLSNDREQVAGATHGFYKATVNTSGEVLLSYKDSRIISGSVKQLNGFRVQSGSDTVRLASGDRSFSMVLGDNGAAVLCTGNWGNLELPLPLDIVKGREVLRTRQYDSWGSRTEFSDHCLMPVSNNNHLSMPTAVRTGSFEGDLSVTRDDFVRLQLAGPNDLISMEAITGTDAKFSLTSDPPQCTLTLSNLGKREGAVFISVQEIEDLVKDITNPAAGHFALGVGPNLLDSLNGDMEKSLLGKPVGWAANTWDGAQMELTSVLRGPHGGNRCAQMKRLNRQGHARMLITGTIFRAEQTTTLRFSYWIRSSRWARTMPWVLTTKRSSITGQTFSQFADSSLSPWIQEGLTFVLDTGESVKGLGFIMEGEPGDLILVDDVQLRGFDPSEKATTPEEDAYVPWRWVPASATMSLPESLRVSGPHKNLIQNPSFESGPDWLISKRHAQIDTTESIHGRASLLVRRKDPFSFKYDETMYVSVSPGRLYTLSFFGKTDAVPGIIPVRILSSFCASRSRWDADVRPGLSVSFAADTAWHRYSISFVPARTLKNMVSVLFCQSPSSRGISGDPAIWIDAVQLEEGDLTDFHLDSPAQVSLAPVQPEVRIDCTDAVPKYFKEQYLPGFRFITTQARDFTWVDNDAIPFKISVWQENPAKSVAATVHVVDYYGREVYTTDRTFETANSQYVEDTLTITGLDMGSYLIRADVTAGQLTVHPEQTLVAKIPSSLDKDSLLQPPIFSFLGDYFERSRNHHRFGFRYLRGLPGWLDFATAWKYVEPVQGRWQFQEKTLDWTQSLGYHVFVNLNGLDRIPEWAAVDKSRYSEGSCENAFGFHLDDFLRYVREVVHQYKGRIRYWEVMNENYWGNKSAKPYANLLTKCYAAIHTEDPSAKVIAPSTYWVKLFYGEWTDSVLRETGTKSIDIFSYHGYVDWYPEESVPDPMSAGLANFKRLMDQYGGRKPLWDTEYGMYVTMRYTDRPNGLCNMTYTYPGPFDGDRLPARKAAQYYLVALAAGTELFHYHNTEFHRLPLMSVDDMVCWHYDGGPSNSLLAMATTARVLSGAQFIESATIDSTARVYIFRTQAGHAVAGIFGLHLETSASVFIPIQAKDVEVTGQVGTRLWPNRDQTALVKPVGGGLEVALSRDVLYITSVNLDTAQFVAAVKRSRIRR